MTAGDDGDWRGGRSPRSTPRSEKAVPSWKQSRATGGSSAKLSSGGWKRRLLILMVSATLVALVALAIYLYWPARALRTHFVLLNLRAASTDFDTASAFELPPELADRSKNNDRREVTHAAPESLGLLQPGDKHSQTNLNNAHVVVIYLQTTLVAAPNGTFRCLLRNSTPNLNTNEYADLQILRDAIKETAKHNPAKKWLLLVDQISPGQEWRTGFLPADLKQEFEKWTSDIPQLAVVLSSSVTDGSEPGTPGTNGRSAFSYYAALGLSRLATKDPKGDITSSEFSRFVRDKTHSWVQNHRNAAGQSVSTFPSGNPRNFFILQSAPAPSVAEDIIVAGMQDSRLAECADLWNRRESLRRKGGVIWAPADWRAATDELKRAERFMLHGLDKEAGESLDLAKKSFGKLEAELIKICPVDTDFQPERGFFRKLYSTLPASHRVETLFPELSAAGAASGMPLIEDVVASHLKPFVDLSGVTEAKIDENRLRRRHAEQAVAQLFQCSASLKHTIPALERSLLHSEDRQFTRISGAVDEEQRREEQRREEQRIDEILTAVPLYVEAHDTAETTLRNILECLQELAWWAAHGECSDSESDQKIWRDVLVANSSDSHVDPDELRSLTDRLNLASSDVTPLSEPARRLRTEIFRLCASARGLKSALEIREPESGYDGPGMMKVTDELSMWNTHAAAALAASLEAAEELCKAATDATTAQRIGQVRIYRMLSSTLDLTCVRAATHNEVLRQLQKWNLTWSGEAGTKAVDDSGADGVSIVPRAVDLEMLWLMQVVNLMPVSEQQTVEIRRMNGFINSLTSAVSEPGPIGEFCEAVRKIWIANQQTVALAAKSTTDHALSELQDADLRTRLYSGFDAKKTTTSVSARMRQLELLQYCLMHADRLVTGLWIEPGEQPPLNQNGWFSRAATLWLDAARTVAKNANVTAEIPAGFNAAMENIRDRLNASDEVMFRGSFSATNTVDLGDESSAKAAINLDVSESVPASVFGAASLLIRLPAESENRILRIDDNAVPIIVGQGNAHIEMHMRRLGNPDRNDDCTFELQPEIFFRGRSWTTTQNLFVNTCAAREFVTDILPRPDTASITVSGDDPRPVILILDFSLSMEKKLADGTTPRYLAAIDTLKRLVERDDFGDAPVVLKVFGHRVRYDDNAKIHRFNPGYEKVFPERPVAKGLSANDDIENMFKRPMRLNNADDKAEFLDVLKKLKTAGFWGITPLIKSTAEAVAIDLGKNSGIVIAITDGEPTDDGDNPRENDRTPDLQRALNDNRGTNVNVVAFDVDKSAGERDRITATFDKFGGRVSIVDASDEAGLRKKIQESLDPRKFTVSWNADTRSTEIELGNSATDLVPGNDYMVKFGSSIAAGPLALNPGDALQLNLLLKEKRFRIFRLTGRAPQKAESKPVAADEPWMIKLVEGVQITDITNEDPRKFKKAVLRLMLDHEDDGNIVRQPAEMEWYVRAADPANANRPGHLSQRYDSRCGAPAWEITIDRWQTETSFLIDAFWKMERSVPERLIDWETLKNADSPATSIRIDENSTGLPAGKAWITQRGQELQVRIDPVLGEPESDANRLTDVRIELGQPDTQEQARTFLPWEIHTSIIRTERGSVIFRFSGDRINPDNLKRAKIAFTSSANRRRGATVIQDFRIQYK